MSQKHTRRDIMKVGLGGLGMLSLGGAAPLLVPKMAHAKLAAGTNVSNDNVHVVVQLSGGNDGLNTVIRPSDEYAKARPKLHLTENLHKLKDDVFLNPGLSGFKSMWDAGQLGVVPAAGYPDANQSHFESMAIWHTADPSRSDPKGWLGHYLDHLARGTTPEAADGFGGVGGMPAVNIGAEVPQALVNEGPPVASIERLEDFGLVFDDRTNFDAPVEEEIIKQLLKTAPADDPKLAYFAKQANNAIVNSQDIQAAANQYEPDAEYPRGLGDRMKLIARLIAGDFGTRVFYVQLGGFDTHANQMQQHENLLRQLGDSLAAFHKDLTAKGLGGKVTTMVFSEFGRRVKQNDAQGTDHGTAGPMFFLGDGVNGGVHAPMPDLNAEALANDNLVHQTDFRRAYATVLDQWLNSDSKTVLRGDYEHLPLIA